MQTNKVRNIFLGFLAIAMVSFFVVSSHKAISQNLAKRDSIAYWAAGKLLIQHQNPYSSAAVLTMERTKGYSETKPLVLRTPPWSLFLVLPLGIMNAFAAWIVWIAISFVALILSVRLCWTMYGQAPGPPTLFTVVAYLFAPVPACLVAGQMGLLLLLGVTFFFWAEEDRCFVAGASLILAFAKPHLLSLFWLVLLIWVLDRRKGAVVRGFVGSLVAAIAVALVMNPTVFADYGAMLHEAAIGHEFIPALSGVIRLIFFRRLFWVQFIPLAIGVIWSIGFYWKYRLRWSWKVYGPALMVVSVLTTPYAWLTDEVVLLPAILQAVVCVYEAKDRLTATSKMIIFIFGALNVLLLLILKAKIPFATGIYFWSSLVWFGWYFYGRRFQTDVGESADELLVTT